MNKRNVLTNAQQNGQLSEFVQPKNTEEVKKLNKNVDRVIAKFGEIVDVSTEILSYM